MSGAFKQFYAFGSFLFDVDGHRLLREGQTVPLPPKAMEALRVFLARPGQVMAREELLQTVWGETFVEDANLTVAVSQLRKALNRNGETNEYIQTIPRVGYRFIADVSEIREEQRRPVVLAKHTLSRTVIEEEEIPAEHSEVRTVQSPTTLELSNSLVRATRRSLLPATAIFLVALAIIASLWTHLQQRSARGANLSIKSIAVLPFQTLGAPSGEDHRGLGLADVLITRLSNIRQLSVRPTSAVIGFDGQVQDLVSAGRKLNVDAVLEGTIYQANNRVRVTARLVRVIDQTPLWAGQFEKPLQDELKVQDEIALQLVDALALSLSGSEKNAMTRRFTDNSDAYQLYLKGRYHWNKRNYGGMIEAQRLFRNAIEKDPQFTLAFVGLADTLATGREGGEAYDAAHKALELDPNLAEAHATVGFIKMFHGWSWREAETAFKKSIELNPGYATAHHWYATLLAIKGRNDEAKAAMLRALEINPLSHNLLADMGQLHYFAGDYAKAKEYCRQALEIYPEFSFAHQYLHHTFLKTGEYDKAMEELISAERANGSYPSQSAEGRQQLEANITRQWDEYRRRGIREFLRSRIAEGRDDANGNYQQAMIYSYLGEKEKALSNLERACRGRAFLTPFVKVDPVFDSLRDEPRYQAILETIGL
jgi:DNA-binding winged helix-turn-helix (wHTH) protein/TolB-like protein/thioredoxin-like negative regulator of GroEL